MEFEKEIIELNTSVGVIIPYDLAKYLNLKKGTKVMLVEKDDYIILKKK